MSAPAVENTSGQGSDAVVPEEIQGWNWGAFLLTWIWGIGNNVRQALIVLIPLAGFIMVIGAAITWGISGEVWIALFLLMPLIGFIMAIVLGVKGSEWAWKSKRWDSIEHFRRTQRTWAWWGTGVSVVWIGLLAAMIIPNVVLEVQHQQLHRKLGVAAELDNIQAAVTAMMVYNNLDTLPNPVGTATNDMGAFPDATSVAGSADKLKDWKGNTYGSGDKNGYLLHGHDETADGESTTLGNYVVLPHTKGTYKVNAAGEVTQVSTGYK